MYATSAATPEGYLYTINTSTGALTAVGTLGFPEINSMAIRHSDRIIYGSYASSTSTTLYRINSESGDAIPTRVIPVGNLRAIAFSPGDTLFGATTTGSLYQINVNTGEANLVGTTPGLTYYGLSFRPGLNQLWASVRTPIDSIYRLNTVTGAATFMGITGFNALTFSLAFNPGGGLLALIDNGSGEDYLASLDTVNAAGTIIAGPLSVNYLQAIAMRTDSTASGVEGTIETLPAMFALHQNYPNPFNPNTTIKYDLPKASFVSLLVYNTLGQQVSQLVNEQQQPGYHEVAFLGDELASGVYFYRLQAGSFVATKKLLLLK
jgi:hypothetical protein